MAQQIYQEPRLYSRDAPTLDRLEDQLFLALQLALGLAAHTTRARQSRNPSLAPLKTRNLVTKIRPMRAKVLTSQPLIETHPYIWNE